MKKRNLLMALLLSNLVYAETPLKQYVQNLKSQPAAEILEQAQEISLNEDIESQVQSLEELDRSIKDSLYYRVQAGTLLGHSLDLSAEYGLEVIPNRLEVGLDGGAYIDGSKRSFGLGPYASYTLHRGENGNIYVKVGARYSKDTASDDLSEDNKFYQREYTGMNKFIESGYQFNNENNDIRLGVKVMEVFGDEYIPNLVFSYKPKK